VMGAVVHGRGVPGAIVWQATMYAILYIAIVLTGAAIVFSRRNLK
jgi:ABC-type transport system involved in multi-copper enzyme maturation permease subunit